MFIIRINKTIAFTLLLFLLPQQSWSMEHDDLNQQLKKAILELQKTCPHPSEKELIVKVANLLEKGANPNLTISYGYHHKVERTPLELAGSTKTELMRVLVHYKANVNKYNHRGWTPLHEYVNSAVVSVPNLILKEDKQECYENIFYLLDHGADPAINTRDGQTTYDLAYHDSLRKCIMRHALASEILPLITFDSANGTIHNENNPMTLLPRELHFVIYKFYCQLPLPSKKECEAWNPLFRYPPIYKNYPNLAAQLPLMTKKEKQMKNRELTIATMRYECWHRHPDYFK